MTTDTPSDYDEAVSRINHRDRVVVEPLAGDPCLACAPVWGRENQVKGIRLCPLHKAAPALRDALQAILAAPFDTSFGEYQDRIQAIARDALTD